MSAALYNRYRPQTFAEIVGQDHVTAALISALGSGRIHHAYLFSGPRGCGKTSSARILAASLNCVNGPTPTPCGTCEHCTAIRTGSSLDVVEIDAASHGGVDDARDLRERALYVPANSRYRIFVIDEAHQVSRDGFNALLKIVEEPPSYLVFVFATTEPDKVIPTIRSRTFSYHFRLVPPAILRDHLARICKEEGADVAPEVLPLVVRAGAGSVRDSMSVLDQLIAGGASTYEQAAALLGVTDVVLLDEALQALSLHDSAGLFGVLDRVVSSGHDPRAFARDLLERLRDLIMLQAVPEAAERGLVEGLPPDQLDRMRRQATALGAAELSRAADVVHDGLVDMRGTTSPRLLLELVAARLLLPAADGSAASVLARLEAVERRLTLSAAHSPVPAAPMAPPASSLPASSPPAAAPPAAARPAAAPPAAARPASSPAASSPPAPSSEPSPSVSPAPTGSASRPRETAAPVAPAAATAVDAAPAGRLDVAALREAWPLVLEAVKRRSRVPHAQLDQYAQVSSVDGNRITLSIKLAPIARAFEAGPGVEILVESLVEVLGGTWRVGVQVGGGEAPGRPPGPATAEPDPGGGVPPSADPDPLATEELAGSVDVPEATRDPLGLLKDAFGATVIEEIDRPD